MVREHLYPRIENIALHAAKGCYFCENRSVKIFRTVFPRKFIPLKYTRYMVLGPVQHMHCAVPDVITARLPFLVLEKICISIKGVQIDQNSG